MISVKEKKKHHFRLELPCTSCVSVSLSVCCVSARTFYSHILDLVNRHHHKKEHRPLPGLSYMRQIFFFFFSFLVQDFEQMIGKFNVLIVELPFIF